MRREREGEGELMEGVGEEEDEWEGERSHMAAVQMY